MRPIVGERDSVNVFVGFGVNVGVLVFEKVGEREGVNIFVGVGMLFIELYWVIVEITA
jgi:hypothetical protein